MVTIEPTCDDANENVNATKPTTTEECSNNGKHNVHLQTEPNTINDAETTGHMDSREGEGWETASEGENEDGIPSVSENYEDAMTEEQQKQRSLEQASAAKAEGNRLFGAGEFEAALTQYANALDIAPDHPMANDIRSVCYANRGICYYKLNKYEETIKESTKALDLNPAYMKALIRRAEAHEKLEHFEEAIADMKKALELDGSNEQARRTIIRLEPLAAEKREKLKEEMIGKLKQLGDSVLGRFGMSVDNFKAVKDPSTGSYSISFQR
ncbi:hypothetical protein SUGI_0754180 [Cryptomeria japonica]|uniref:uncharacterized protein LOC131048739 n=1 Tax=Cryptomeria japonica TaxID=3369 RepID=UPI002414C64B|nr:uncharacterized protein LOC131048739 [Cryptomeria japonica]GLJ37178.1 hypothetical protein SUGI_0754180 [Cryptomeria japonica]